MSHILNVNDEEFEGAVQKVVESPGSPLDLDTLNAVHFYWEFQSKTNKDFDIWLHGQTIKAVNALAEKQETCPV